MERNKRKSKALIITFIVILLLLLAFYFLIIKNNPFQTKSATTENKGFFSLFSKSKEKEVDLIDNINTDNGEMIDGSVDLGNTDNTNAGNINNGDLQDGGFYTDPTYTPYNPRLSPVPTPDPYNPNTNTYTPPVDTITRTNPPETTDRKQCNFDDYKLTYTEAEKAELDKLLREFYRISASIKTQEDIDLEYEARKSYIGLVDEAKDLTKQCYIETSTPKYLAGFDWANSKFDETRDVNGLLVSKNYSRPSEARVEKRPNPWFGTDKDAGYFYVASVVNRSERFSRYPKGYRISSEPYNSTVYADSADARNACITAGNAKANSERARLPSTFTVSSRCDIVEALNSQTNPIRNSKKDMWYPTSNWTNTSNSDINPEEYYVTEQICQKRYPTCTQKYKNDFSSTVLIPGFEWVYSVTAQSGTFSTLTICENTRKAYGHPGSCKDNSGERAYILKLWEQNITDGYVSPIDYNIFERMFNIW